MKNITAKTKLAAILGNPVGHSLSPGLHCFLAEQMGVDLAYLAFSPERESLRAALDGALSMGFLGFNITAPFKIDVKNLLDVLDPEAEKMGNVNTVVNEQGKWKGYNTDGDGFILSLKRSGVSVGGKDALLLGTGGTARTLSYKLAQNGAKSITIASRKTDILPEFRMLLAEFPQVELHEGVNPHIHYDLIVNCTPLGMKPHEEKNPMPEGLTYDSCAVYCDLIYNPPKTLFLQQAKKIGAKVINGMDMFLYQGILAFEHFTGVKVSDAACEAVFEKWSNANDKAEKD
ncbi:MAG: shikimate dehydrogenase [Clostridia bacterium]|nr:shikimate dehydrogenase [Clostridia bacterium]